MPSQITRMNPPTLPDAGQLGYSQISIAGPLAFVSGQVAWTPEGGAAPGDLVAQTETVLQNLQHALDALGATSDDIVQLRIFVIDLTPERQERAMAPLGAFLNGACPSITGVGVTALAAPDLEVEIEMVVQVPG